jgi:hypothetical protein
MKAIARSLAAAVIVAGSVLSLARAATMPMAASGVDEELLAMSNEFELGNGQSRLLVDHKQPEPYRICVKQGAGVVPLQVSADGKLQNVNAGSCADFNAAKIRIQPASKLAKDEVLIGKYKRVSKG